MTREELDITRWRGFSHAELYTQLHSGPGATASAVPAGRWADLAGTLHDINQDLTQAITQAKTSWAGTAANAAFAQLSDVAVWASRVGNSATSMQASVEQQADHIGRARAAMPAPGAEPTPQPDPLLAPVAQLVGLQSDHEPIERATSDAARRAFEVMQTYQNDTTATTDALAAFEEPADLSGVHTHRNRNLLNVLGFTQTSSVGPAPGVPEQQHRRHHHWEPRGQLVSQAGAGMFVEPEVNVRQPVAPLQQGAMAGADPISATPQRDPNARRGSSVPGRLMPAMDVSSISGAAPAGAPNVTPSSAATGGGAMGGASDRVTPRRIGEPLISSQLLDDAAEPANQANRRRDRNDEKITESVDGSGSEVPPPVIGKDPYRQ